MYEITEFFGLIIDFFLHKPFKRKPHIRKVLKKEGLNLTKKQYVDLCYGANLTVNDRMILPDERLENGVHVVRVYSGGRSISFWVEVYRKKARAYTM